MTMVVSTLDVETPPLSAETVKTLVTRIVSGTTTKDVELGVVTDEGGIVEEVCS